MFADPEIPVRVADPGHVEFILEVETRHHIRPAEQLVEDDAIVDPLDPHFATVALVEQLAAALPDFR